MRTQFLAHIDSLQDSKVREFPRNIHQNRCGTLMAMISTENRKHANNSKSKAKLFDDILLNFWDQNGASVCKSCRSWKMPPKKEAVDCVLAKSVLLKPRTSLTLGYAGSAHNEWCQQLPVLIHSSGLAAKGEFLRKRTGVHYRIDTTNRILPRVGNVHKTTLVNSKTSQH